MTTRVLGETPKLLCDENGDDYDDDDDDDDDYSAEKLLQCS